MTYSTSNVAAHPQTQPSTCTQCSYFEDYQGTRNRGYCKVFDKVVRSHPSKTETCQLSIEFRELKESSQPEAESCLLKADGFKKATPFLVYVELITEAIEDNGEGYPVPVDDKRIKVKVSEMTKEAVHRQVQGRKDCEGYKVVDFWQPVEEDIF